MEWLYRDSTFQAGDSVYPKSNNCIVLISSLLHQDTLGQTVLPPSPRADTSCGLWGLRVHTGWVQHIVLISSLLLQDTMWQTRLPQLTQAVVYGFHTGWVLHIVVQCEQTPLRSLQKRMCEGVHWLASNYFFLFLPSPLMGANHHYDHNVPCW